MELKNKFFLKVILSITSILVMALFQHLSYRFEFSGHLILQKLCKCIDVTAFFLAIIYAKSAEDYVKLMYYEKEEKYKSKRKNNKENATN